MEEFLDLAIDVVVDAGKDTLLVIPFLLVTYLVMEWLEHKTSDKAKDAVKKAGVAGPVVGALLGVVPQCGFSTAAATFYAGRVITLGTLFAVFLSTSDEMLPIFIAAQMPAEAIFGVLGCKVIIGMIMGFAVDGVLRLLHRNTDKLRIDELCEESGCHCDERCSECEITCEKCHIAQGDDCHGMCDDDCHDHSCHDHGEEAPGHLEAGTAPAFQAAVPEEYDECCCIHHHDHGYDDPHGHHHMHDHHEHGAGSIVKSAVKHTAQITIFVFIVSVVLNAVLACVGEEVLGAFIEQNEAISVLASAVVGLIPNCAASVAIAELYAQGVLSAGAMMAGLLVSAGVGLLVLCRTNRIPRQNLAIIITLLAMGVICGWTINLLGIAF